MVNLNQLLDIDPRNGTPLYQQIASGIISNIRQGHLRKGLNLPGSRELAKMLTINRLTVVAAYEELESQGWVQSLPRKGVFVKVELPSLSPVSLDAPSVFHLPESPFYRLDESNIPASPLSDFQSPGKLIFNDGFPDVRLTPVDELISTMRSISKIASAKKYLMYGGAQGTTPLRDALTSFLSDTRGLPISRENILVTRGAQMGIYLAAAVLIKPGDEAIVGTPGYAFAARALQHHGAIINHVPVDESGIDTTEIEKKCRLKKIRLLYVIPHHHNPTTVTLSPERRMHLLELARKYKFAIIEDDYDYDFHYSSRPIMPMASHDRYGNVIYIGTLTKTLAPAIRFGFMVGPSKLIDRATSLRRIIDTQGDSLTENAIAELYNNGSIARHIKKSVKTYKERRDTFCELLRTDLGKSIAFKVPDGGMSVWINFLSNDLKKISAKAFQKGLVIRDGTSYDSQRVKYNSVRCGFASLTPKELERAVKILASCM
jgi:GntR family transcriptional regulator/MocR family aminotransferase